MDVFSTKESHVDVLLTPEAQAKYFSLLTENGIEVTIINDNWQRYKTFKEVIFSYFFFFLL